MPSSISILEQRGVSSVMLETKLLAREAAKQRKKRILDMGTGTGYIAIYLTMKGYKCDGADISKKAIKTAKLNSRRNKVKVNFFESDLFENVKDKYDLIVFNPPLGDFRGNILIDTVKSTVRSIPPLYKSIRKIMFNLFFKQKIELNKRFIKEARSYLNKDGRLLLLIFPDELNTIENMARELGFEPVRISIKELMKKRNLLLLLLKMVA